MGIALKNLTPFPDLPLIIANKAQNTDAQGEFVVSVPQDDLISISSGLPAIVFTPIAGTATKLAATYHQIDVTSLIEPQEFCQVNLSGIDHLYISYMNKSQDVLTVRADTSLNKFTPIRNVSPESYFLPLQQGFVRPRNLFSNGDAWTLLGSTIYLPEDRDIPICKDRGDSDWEVCTPVATNLINDLFVFTRRVVGRASEDARKAFEQGRIKTKVRISPPFYKAAAQVLSKMRRIVEGLPKTIYVCEGGQNHCISRQLPKEELASNFARLCKAPLPKSLEFIRAMCRKTHTSRFRALLNKLPDNFSDCS